MKVSKLYIIALLSLSFKVSASDEMLLVGKYEYRTDPESLEYIGSQVCFFPDNETAKQIKRENRSNRMVWFCFVPNNEAKIALKVPIKENNNCGYTGKASVVVTNYKDLGGFQADTAELRRVVSLGSPTEITCK